MPMAPPWTHRVPRRFPRRSAVPIEFCGACQRTGAPSDVRILLSLLSYLSREERGHWAPRLLVRRHRLIRAVLLHFGGWLRGRYDSGDLRLSGTRLLENELAARCPIGRHTDCHGSRCLAGRYLQIDLCEVIPFYGLSGAVPAVGLGKYRILRNLAQSSAQLAHRMGRNRDCTGSLSSPHSLERKSIRVPDPDLFNSHAGRHRARLERLLSLLAAVHAGARSVRSAHASARLNLASQTGRDRNRRPTRRRPLGHRFV